ncbi:MAG: hypothetical protein RIS64_779 [Bacteroidota bacterium]|jgi:hypothetical protein
MSQIKIVYTTVEHYKSTLYFDNSKKKVDNFRFCEYIFFIIIINYNQKSLVFKQATFIIYIEFQLFKH